MTKDQAKSLFKVFLMIYLVSFSIINWNNISWVFNYKEVSGLINDFFNPYPSIEASAVGAYFYPNRGAATAQNSDKLKTIKTAYTDKQNSIEVPKISISAPIIFSTTTDKSYLAKDLNSGVIYYPGSVYPGQAGQIVILGHSAPAGWPKIKYDWVFTDLDKLEGGDSVFINLDNNQYKYIVRQKKIIKRGADVPSDGLAQDKNILTLISCWPPGKDYQRIAVQAELVSNDQ